MQPPASAPSPSPGPAASDANEDGQPSTATYYSDNLSLEQRESIVEYADLILRGPGEFAKSVGSRLELTKVVVGERYEDGKMHAEVVFEIATDIGV